MSRRAADPRQPDSRSPLGPGALAERLVDLPLVVESTVAEVGSASLAGYYEAEPRPTAFVTIAGRGEFGVGECVGWTRAEQERFAKICPALAPIGSMTVGELHARLAGAEPYHAAAVEAAAIDLALRQASTNLFALSGRPIRSIAWCRSLGAAGILAAGGPVAAVVAALDREPEASIKIDVDPAGWSATVWRSLAELRRVVVVDFKLQGDVREVALVHRWMPDAWIEDPPPAALDPVAPWRRRVALDGYVARAADLVPPPVVPGAVNVKAARLGGPLEALRVLEVCNGAGWAAYTGGMFEAGPGRLQARVLASLYTPDAWNDVAPLAPEHGEATERLELPADFEGFAPRP